MNKHPIVDAIIMSRRLTFSALARVFACPASHVLPHRAESDEPSPARDRGTAIHAYLDGFSKGADDPLSHVPPEYREACEAIPLEDLPTHLSHELGFAFDPVARTARLLSQKHHRDYSQARPGEIVGQVDVVGGSAHAVFVGDYKSGWSRQIPARENPQLLAGALCATRVYGKSRAVLDIISVREDRPPWHDQAEVDAFELLAFEDRLCTLARLINIGDPQSHLHTGDHCRYCPAFEACPEQTKLAVIATDGTLAERVEREWAGLLTADTASDALEQAKMMQILATRAMNLVRAYAREHPIDRGGGRWYGPVDRLGVERLDGEVVHACCQSLYGGNAADAVCGRTATKKGVAAGLRRYKELLGGTQKDAMAQLLAAVRAAGGATRKPTSKVEEYDG